MLSLPAVLYAVNPPRTYQATNLNSESDSVNALNNEFPDNFDENKKEEVVETIIEEEKENLETPILEVEENNAQVQIEDEDNIDENKGKAASKRFTNSIIEHPKWQENDTITIPRENSFTPRRMRNFFVSDSKGGARMHQNAVYFAPNEDSSVILNNVGSYMGENINIRVTVKADLQTKHPYPGEQGIMLYTDADNFLSYYISGGGDYTEEERVPVEFKWEFLTDEGEPIEVGTYFKSTNANFLKDLIYINDSVKYISSMQETFVEYRDEDQHVIMGSDLRLDSQSDTRLGLLVVFEVNTQIEFATLTNSNGVSVIFNQNPGVEIEISSIENIDTLKTEFTNEEDITLEWSVGQEVPFVTPGAWYQHFFIDYQPPASLLQSELWNSTSQFELIVENSSGENVTKLFTKSIRSSGVMILATEAALQDSSFYGDSYKFSLRLHLDNDVSIKESLLDESGFLETDVTVVCTSLNGRLRGDTSTTLTRNKTNFNSKVTLNLITSEHALIGEQFVEDILTHEITIDPPQMEGYEFKYVSENIDLSNVRLNSTNQSLNLVYDKMTQPDIPAINPEDGTLELENTNPEDMSWLSIRYASSLDFGVAKHVENGQELFSLPSVDREGKEIPNMITIQDMRPEDNREGWQLQVRQTSELVGGAQIVMNPEVHESVLSGNDLSVHEGDLILNTDSQVFASASETNSNQIISFGMHRPEAEGVRLLIPSGMGVRSYHTTLEWNLVSGP